MDKALSDLWWKNAIFYCLDVETFVDSDGDGIGDFRGLTRRVDYLAGLGVTCVWLMPFYPTPNADDGYDVSDYYSVDGRYGTLGDFVEFVRTARERGIRVIADLVVNHTSVAHPWFQEARRDRSSPKRDWYVWSDEPLAQPSDIVFPDTEESNWEWDEEAGQYYLHRFYAEQPDLNVAKPEVRDEINRIIGFWMELGLSGFRVDAVPYLIGEAGIRDEMPDQPHVVLREMRSFMGRRRGDAVMIGEVNLDPGERMRFFGQVGEEMNCLFNFVLAGGVMQALAAGDVTELAEHLRGTPAPPDECQWINFLRNHDELNLSRLPESQRRTVMDAFAPREDMRVHGRGIRRRLPPMVDGDARRLRLLYSVLLTLPGSPVLLYGEEIGMGDDLSLDDRMSVRTVMQWSSDLNGGFSTADRLVRSVVEGGPFGKDRVNVADQRRDPDSMLNWMERAIRTRKQCGEFGLGAWSIVGAGTGPVLAHRCDWLDGTAVAVHNFSDRPQRVELPLDGLTVVGDVFSDRAYDPVEGAVADFEIGPYGFRWFQGRRSGSRAVLQ